jgi:hypothetical protein
MSRNRYNYTQFIHKGKRFRNSVSLPIVTEMRIEKLCKNSHKLEYT